VQFLEELTGYRANFNYLTKQSSIDQCLRNNPRGGYTIRGENGMFPEFIPCHDFTFDFGYISPFVLTLNSSCNSYFKALSVWEKWGIQEKRKTFELLTDSFSFGVVGFNNLDEVRSTLRLKGSFKILNTSNKTITIQTRASGHTACADYQYTIAAGKKETIYFTSLISGDRPSGKLYRRISLVDRKSNTINVYQFDVDIVQKEYYNN